MNVPKGNTFYNDNTCLFVCEIIVHVCKDCEHLTGQQVSVCVSVSVSVCSEGAPVAILKVQLHACVLFKNI